MAEPAAIVTGPERGIGQAIAIHLRTQGWYVIGIGLDPTSSSCDHFIKYDLSLSENSADFGKNCIQPAIAALAGRELRGLVNNAAVQILGSLGSVDLSEWQKTLTVNLTAPMLLCQAFADRLQNSSGAIVNIGSVHSQATKPKFISYATSKAALHGLTKALAVDLGGKVRVCAVAPAAIATEMLEAGFDGRPDDRARLAAFHPAQKIGDPGEVARAVAFLLDPATPFLTGSILYLDGGILSRLHDPS
ncbi:SDR family oxidoreductase [Altererythrobacter sp.]|uniref:SDR family NAD(P)-dependent oxidoreductase n=1 Tax=Altererythrobacter sp. TaxID=1872480 RepID=UPI001B08BD43|nr:SDR family oxidoreductase [Altererythrobacter sp.]MBO6609860.1 SDR family oxidoreductase [Altererythrobacter sp.]MBO6642216.1 SDR family oxidoreductase [Altererythrobacter sp.]MBO6709276.1 SDR family oxidoreductase [Altererythrobacter sp.]